MAEHKECPFAKELTSENGGMCRYTGYYCTYQYESRCEVKKMHTQKQTNADRIRSMSDEELAEFLAEYEVCTNCQYLESKCEFDGICTKGFASAMAYEWLKSEAKE
jgi:hypothetical protein